MPVALRGSETEYQLEGAPGRFRSGDALFAFNADLRIVSWNRAAEELTGISGQEAVGRFCWDVLGGQDDWGAIVCHRGCSHARLAREGWPVSSQELLIKTGNGRRCVSLSTVAVNGPGEPVFLHLMKNGPAAETDPPPGLLRRADAPALTPRQLQVLELIGEGLPAKVIAARLGVAETTVRNHIRALLLELRCHSQLEAVAKARHLRII